MKFVRGEIVGHGSFATVSLAIPIDHHQAHTPRFMAVKSAPVTCSSSLVNETRVLNQLSDCPHLVRYFGHCCSYENGGEIFNMFLEYASQGSLADHLRNCGSPVPESDVRWYTRSVLEGLKYIHENGFVHCDIKLQNLLVVRGNDEKDVVKIADFGLAKKAGERKGFRGTPLYMSPETVMGGENEAPADIWSLGCALVEMVTGKPAWYREYDVSSLLFKIGAGDELPGIPTELSEDGKDFLKKCFIKDPKERWTAGMLLNHPFVSSSGDDTVSLTESCDGDLVPSPRCPFDFPECLSADSNDPIVNTRELETPVGSWGCSDPSENRIRELIRDDRPDWSDSQYWVTVR